MRWSGRHARVMPAGWASRCATKRSRSAASRSDGGSPPGQHGPGVGVERGTVPRRASSARLAASLGRTSGRRRPTGRRGGRAAPRRSPPRTATPAPARVSRKPSGSSRSAAVGSRSGCIHTPSRPSVPWRVRSEPHRVEASRSRRGRSSRPTRVAKVCSAGPPAARRRRTASCSLAADGIRSWVAWPTTSSTQPSTRARVTSRRSSAACWAGDLDRSNSPPSIASCIAAGFIGSMPRSFSSMPEVSISMPAAVAGDRADQVVAQPRDVGEEPLVGGLAQREVEQHVVGADVELGGEGRDVGGQQRGLAGRAQGEADVGGAQHVAGERPEALPTWVATIAPLALPSMAMQRPGDACALLGHRLAEAAVAEPATGSTSSFQTSRVSTIHSARDQAAVVVTPEGNSVVVSSQWSARRTASAMASPGPGWAWGRAAGRRPCGRCRRPPPS